MGDGECLKILRVEDGDLGELVSCFLEITKGYNIPAGTIVTLSSLGQLARSGPAAYAMGLREAVQRLTKTFGKGIKIASNIPIPAGETSGELVRYWIEVDTWLEANAGYARLPEASGKLRDHFNKGKSEADGHTWRGIWPSSLTSSHSKVRVSTGLGSFNSVPAPNEISEHELLTVLIKELNSKFAAGLAEAFSSERLLDLTEAVEAAKEKEGGPTQIYVLLGASHASRILEELEEAGHIVVNLTRPGWRPDSDEVYRLVDELARTLATQQQQHTVTIVYQLLDNAIFYGLEDGTLQLPRKLHPGGRYHVKGRLVLADHSKVKDLLYNILPLLRAGGDHRKIVISPMQRYIPGKCCTEAGHITNYGEASYASDMVQALNATRDQMRSFLYKKKIKNFRVVSGEKLLGWEEGVTGSELARLWGADPVHLTTAGYKAMAEKIVEIAADPQPFTNGTGSSKDRTLERSSWVQQDDSTAPRFGGQHAGRQLTVRGRGRGGRWRPYPKKR